MAHISGTSASETLTGTSADDVIVGGFGADTLIGGAGNDHLGGSGRGGRGADDPDDAIDILTGGVGADIFHADHYVANLKNPKINGLEIIDRITDFSVAEGDRIALDMDNNIYFLQERYTTWRGEVTSADFSLASGNSFGDVYLPGYSGIFTWTSGSVNYVIVDTNGDGLLDRTDFVIAAEGAPRLDRGSFIGDYIVDTPSKAGSAWTGSEIGEKFFGGEGPDAAWGQGGNDELHGGNGDDVLHGGDGDDTLHGERGGDALHGEAGNDVMWASPIYNGYVDGSPDKLYGGAGNDTLYGSDGSDILDGGDGNDVIDAYWMRGKASDVISGGAGDDIISAIKSVVDGGSGNDTIVITGNGSTLTGGAGADLFRFYLLSPPHAEVPSYQNPNLIRDFSIAQGDKLEPLSNSGGFWPLAFYGPVDNSAFSLALGAKFSVASAEYGAGLKQVWTWQNEGFTYLIVDENADGALGTHDSVLKFDGAVTMSAAAFADSMVANVGGATDGSDLIQGTSGLDRIYGLGGADRLHGGGGDDEIYGNSAADQIWGEDGQDKIYGGPGNDMLDGGQGNDEILGNAGADTIHGGDGDDRISTQGYMQGYEEPGDTADTINVVYGGAGDDAISGSQSGYAGSGASLHDQLNGGDGNDTVIGNGVLRGDAGDDYVQGGGELYGDAGNDNLLAVGSATLRGGDGDDSLTVRTDFVGIASVGVLYGDAGQDRLYGGDGADVLWGGSEDDILTGGAGADSLDGGGGSDTASYAMAIAGVAVDLSTSTAQNTGGAGVDRLVSIEHLKGSSYADTLVGDQTANRLEGGGGDDMLRGGGGDDTLHGGAGADFVSYETSLVGVAVDLSIATSQNTIGAGADLLVEIENIKGSGFDDRLKGNLGANVLQGGDGADLIDGEFGGDRLEGGAGDDTLRGGSGQDTLWGGDGRDAIEGGADFDQINGNVGNDTAYGGEGGDWVVGGKDNDVLHGENGADVVNGNLGDDTCNGGADADWVRGGQGDDVLDGGAGNDWLSGDRGNDAVTGGAGGDTFYFFAGAAVDRVTDFSSASGDRVLLDPGQAYTLSYTAEGAVVSLGAGDQMILMGVTQASIGDWLHI